MRNKSLRVYFFSLLSVIIVYRTALLFIPQWDSNEATVSKKINDQSANRTKTESVINEGIIQQSPAKTNETISKKNVDHSTNRTQTESVVMEGIIQQSPAQANETISKKIVDHSINRTQTESVTKEGIIQQSPAQANETISKKIVDHSMNRTQTKSITKEGIIQQSLAQANETIATNDTAIQPNQYDTTTAVLEKIRQNLPTEPILNELSNQYDTPIAVLEKIQQNLPTEPILTELFEKFNETANAMTTHPVPDCLSNPDLPTPVILMTLGRSGSTVLWQMLSTLTKSRKSFRTSEYVGGNLQANLFFFDSTIRPEEKVESRKNWSPLFLKGAKINEIPGKNNCEHGEWLLNYICSLRKGAPGGGNAITGFKWKPSLDQFLNRAEARESLQLLASLASAALAVEQKPPIIVVRSRRNAVDVALSSFKHKESKKKLVAHCHKGDVECVSKHAGKQFIESPKQFYRKVLMTWIEENFFDEVLYAFNIPHVSVSYDTLFYPDQISDGEGEWNRMMQFVSPSLARLSWADILDSMEHEPTRTTRNHKDIIANWEDVFKVFQDTEVEHLLRMD